jgi:hypothetical protein
VEARAEEEVEQAAVLAEGFGGPEAQVEPPPVAPSDSNSLESRKETPMAKKKEEKIEEAKPREKGKGPKKAKGKAKAEKKGKTGKKGKGKKGGGKKKKK